MASTRIKPISAEQELMKEARRIVDLKAKDYKFGKPGYYELRHLSTEIKMSVIFQRCVTGMIDTDPNHCAYDAPLISAIWRVIMEKYDEMYSD